MTRLAVALLLLGGGAWLGAAQGWRQGVAWGLGAALGAVMLLASFSFAAAFRHVLGEGRGAGIRAHMLLLAATTVLILPAVSAGAVAGQEVRGLVFAPGLAVAVGALLFGVGMQLGGGCASGTLFAVGGGNGRMMLTLACFVAGATLASWQAELWAGWPAPAPVALAEAVGLGPALLGSLAVFALVAWLTWRWERRRHGAAERTAPALLWAGLALAGLNFATLLAVGRPWAITAAFPLWGAKAVAALGLDEPAFWPFWEDPTRVEALLRPVWADRTTAMDVGMVLGAALAAAWGGRMMPRWRVAPGEAAASVAGGLLLGVGAVMASGCNISAYVGGIASGSLHGWLWIGPALLGNALGRMMRPAFGISRN
jgi:uncharacterized membrane protein YedE/YeeE